MTYLRVRKEIFSLGCLLPQLITAIVKTASVLQLQILCDRFCNGHSVLVYIMQTRLASLLKPLGTRPKLKFTAIPIKPEIEGQKLKGLSRVVFLSDNPQTFTLSVCAVNT